MMIYLLGCLATIIMFLLTFLIEYKLEKHIVLRIQDLFCMFLFVIASWGGFTIISIVFIIWLLDECGDKIIFKK